MAFAPARRSPITAVLLTLLLSSASGCLVTRVKWVEPKFAASRVGCLTPKKELPWVEQLYATALEQESKCCESCVDLFFEVAIATMRYQGPACSGCRGRSLHKSALNKLVINGQRYGRLDPRSSLLVRRGGGEQSIPITHHGFVWETSDFHALVPVGKYKTNGLSTLYRKEGVGVPLVVKGCRPSEGTFVSTRPTFAATLCLDGPACDACGEEQGDQEPASYSLKLYDSLRVDKASLRGQRRCLAKDLSAPLAYRIRNDRQTILEDFINPGSATGETELRSIEPYQRGKVPVVFIHGLLSNPYTWVEMINELQAYPGFVDHFQIWVVEYPTGQPFLTSSAQCREQLRLARHAFDPSRDDPQLSNMVLVGHSMGGIVSKLQVTSSGQRLWRTIANRPFSQVAIPPEIRQQLSDAFFFEPSRDVTRVVFIGTPHRGSGFSNRLVGRLGASLVREPDELVQAHAELMRNNPGVFSDEVRRRIPTSIDLLNPKSKLLNAIASLPAKCGVPMHSVIGDCCCSLGGKSDGVVPVRSAREDRAITERFIFTRHTRLTKHPSAVEELVCILHQHLATSAADGSGAHLNLAAPPPADDSSAVTHSGATLATPTLAPPTAAAEWLPGE